MLAVDPDFEREPEAAKADDEVQVRVQRLQNVSDSLCQTGRPRRRTHKLSLNDIKEGYRPLDGGYQLRPRRENYL
ncbi:MAG: hypothetical protein GX161_03200 [Firmicutes bacterium]|nr:hypothetical protein [Bacillota bacterium]